MLKVCQSWEQKTDKPPFKPEDIIVTKYQTITEYKDGCKIERRVPKKVNVTKLVNETKKLLKNQTAEEKLSELERIFSK